jgi:hypothetical protein
MSQQTRSYGPESIYAALRAAGHASMWDYLRANRGIPLRQLSARLGNLVPITVQQMAVDECLGSRQMGALLRDLCARDICERLASTWGEADEKTREAAADASIGLRAPYRGRVKEVVSTVTCVDRERRGDADARARHRGWRRSQSGWGRR